MICVTEVGDAFFCAGEVVEVGTITAQVDR